MCGACYDACPVKINIPEVPIHLRQTVRHPRTERAAMRILAGVMSRPRRYRAALRAARAGGNLVKRGARPRVLRRLPWPASRWTATRDAPLPATETFGEWWARERS